MNKRQKTTLITIAAFILIVIVALIAWRVLTPAADANDSANKNTPDFQAVLPAGKTIDSLGGWQKLTPPNNEPTYVYIDTISEVSINVSQQKLPESFKDNIAQKVEELAKEYNSTNVIRTGDVTAYVGTSAQGPQSVIFTKNNLLILIKSQKQIDNSAWKSYIESLN